MRGLILFVRRRAGDAERGSVSVLVAVMLGGGVLLGAAAISIDVGQLYVEREQLLTGADAAALAVARDCAWHAGTCTGQVGTAAGYADRNANDGASTVSVVCGRARGLGGCPAPTGSRADCLGTAPAEHGYVEVHTATELPDGSTLLPTAFAAALLGNGDYRGRQLVACARVAWGPPLSVSGFAVTLSTCDWQQMTGGAPQYLPPGTLPPTDAEGVLYLHGSHSANTCPAGPSGWDAPGGFGWLDDPSDTCATTVSVSGQYGGDTGASPSQACKVALSGALASRQPVLLPVYDGVRGTGSGTVYHLSGFSSFILTGYQLPGASEASWLTGKQWCTGATFCLYGFFTTAVLPGGGPFGGDDYGTEILKVVG
jgi:Flp pilus assembly protein TadG